MRAGISLTSLPDREHTPKGWVHPNGTSSYSIPIDITRRRCRLSRVLQVVPGSSGVARNGVGCMDTMTLPGPSALERQGWDALCNQTGSSSYGSLMIDDAVMVRVTGFTRIGKMWPRPPTRRWHGTRYTISDDRIVRVGAEATALV